MTTPFKPRVLWVSDNKMWIATSIREDEFDGVHVNVTNTKTDVTTEVYKVGGTLNDGILSGNQDNIVKFPKYAKEGISNAINTENACIKLREMYPIGSAVKILVTDYQRGYYGPSATTHVIKDDKDISRLVAIATGMKYSPEHGGIRGGTGGTSFSFNIGYAMGRALYNGLSYCTGRDRSEMGNPTPRCPSNDHSNGDRDYDTSKLHSDAGYSLSAIGI